MIIKGIKINKICIISNGLIHIKTNTKIVIEMANTIEPRVTTAAKISAIGTTIIATIILNKNVICAAIGNNTSSRDVIIYLKEFSI